MFTPIFIINDKACWCGLSNNPNAIHILEKHLDKVNWFDLSRNPNAIPILEQHLDKVDWQCLSRNPNAIHLFTKLDTKAMSENCKAFAEELTAYVFHPVRMQNMSQSYGYDLDEYIEYFM